VHYPEARKFSLFFAVDGNVLVGIDNHKGPITVAPSGR
jgi:hypothetical protein